MRRIAVRLRTSASRWSSMHACKLPANTCLLPRRADKQQPTKPLSPHFTSFGAGSLDLHALMPFEGFCDVRRWVRQVWDNPQ